MYGFRDELVSIRARCMRSIYRNEAETPREVLRRLAALPEALEAPDSYGMGVLVQRLEAEVAALLGKEAAVFMTKGVAAQQIALRLWVEQSGRAVVALHPRSHFRLDEREPLTRLHPIIEAPIGRDYEPFTLADLEALHERPGAVTVELPLRRAGYKLPSFEALAAMSAWCRRKEVPLHFDGARLWESAPYYGRSLAEISALADSVYVSLYKGLGGLGGCVLAGSQGFIDAARVWQTRMGAVLPTAFPLVLAGLDGLQRYLPEMPGYVARAREIALALTAIPGVRVAPEPPQTNGFHVFLPGQAAELEKRHAQLAADSGVWFFQTFAPTQVPGVTMVEIEVLSAAAVVETSEIVAAVRTLIASS
ncbi:threonine aldolase family protein [Govanella unica]|uniref:Beta-eliminating lyase-related protein n=1 Tax=Govanella unica TaxID=2975056 RepID=A0A9X3TYB0_9PROT|nr:beta-eliminating lyase-related protein [Govania unica]MDA5193964.1 beta-eliminating lyase-related protein [Govania unica]